MNAGPPIVAKPPFMSTVDVVVIGASAGGVEALSRLVALLPADLPAAVLVVLHFPESATSVLPAILMRSGPMRAHHAVDEEPLLPGSIYVAPPAVHLLIHESQVRLVKGARENGHRPAIDPLFRTAARACGPRVIGVLLTGLLDDGTLGLSAIKRHGGTTIVQNPEEATFADMPRNAMQAVNVDYVLPLEGIAAKLVELAGSPAPEWKEEHVPDQTEFNLAELQRLEAHGTPSAFVCPECQGTLFELTEDGIAHYRCRVGHTYSSGTLANEQAQVLEAALWTALRAVKEHNSLLERMLNRAEARGYDASAKTFREKVQEGRDRMELLSRALGLTRHAHVSSEEDAEVDLD